MGIKSTAARWFAKTEKRKIERWANNPIQSQAATFRYLCKNVSQTDFGKAHGVNKDTTPTEWSSLVPLVDYEDIAHWVEDIRKGKQNVLWPGKPLYFCKTSGTTSGTKYIPMTSEGLKAQTRAARSALLSYIDETGNSEFTSGKMIFLQGSPTLVKENGIGIGRLSGIVAHHVPSYLLKNRLPSWDTNCMEDWEAKVDAIVDETIGKDLRLISGIPPWVQMYFERLLAKTGKETVSEVFPNFSLFAHGGVNYEPYRPTMDNLIGKKVDSLETYPASEGFIAFQDSQHSDGMLLNLDGGIYYEFVPVDQIHSESPDRLSLSEVQVGVNYAIVLNTSSGLFGYVIGDTVKFTETEPYRLVVTGRIKHFISAFGEHVIGEEVDKAMAGVCKEFGIEISEFHVAPEVNPKDGLPYHEWFIEFDGEIGAGFTKALDAKMCELNTYYADLIEGSVLREIVITQVPRNSFNAYMASIGKLGGQNKLPRLSNDRKIADFLTSAKVH